MAKAKENAKKFIVSCRIDNHEMDILKERADRDGVSITQLLRSCLDFVEGETRRQASGNQKYACG